MTQENKELLMVDLCGRLPYGVKVEHLLHAPNNPSDLFAIDVDKQVLYCDHKGREEWYKVEFVKPYLRPMTSMTEDERKEWKSLIFDENFARLFYKNDNSIELWVNRHSDYDLEIDFNLVLEAISWLLSHHFDFRGLLDKGLAIEVTKDNNPYN